MAEEFELDQEILVEFIKETLEELDGLDPKFIALEKNPKDMEVLNAIFRTMHSIKGSSAFFNLNHIRNFAHKLEFLLDDLRKGARTASKDIINVLLRGKDHLDHMLNRLASGDMEVSHTPDEAALLAHVEGILASKEEAVKEIKPHQVFLEIDKLRFDLATEGLIDKEPVERLLEQIERLREAVLGPEARPSGEIAPPLGKMLVLQGLISEEDVEEALTKQKKLGEILVEEGKVTPEAVEKAASDQRQQAQEIAEAKKKKETSPIAGLKKTMRIEEEKIDSFMDVVGELIINAEVFNYLQKKLEGGMDIEKSIMEFKNANVDFSELIFNLQKGLAEVRKVSIKGIFQKLPRMVRDLAEAIGKKADIVIRGEDLLLDKSLFEQLESPLNHIIRNAVDHGLETPDVRQAAGKNPVGTVEVIAEETKGEFVIRIRDDGKGMDAAKLRAKAVEKGVLTAAQADAMPDKEAYKLIFAPGFSTAEKVTDVSGRGVGMDVVMTTLKENKGKVDISTTLGRGTEFTLSLPLSNTLITISGLVVAVGKEKYIVPMEWIRESIHPSRQQVSSVKTKGEIVQIRDHIYPLIRLHQVFGVTPKHKHPWNSVVMVIDREGLQCCLMVDEIIEETQVVLKDLGKMFHHIPGILGGAILGDGNVGLVVNIEGLLRTDARSFADQ